MKAQDSDPRSRVFEDDAELFSFIGRSAVVPIRINVIGSAEDPRILVVPASALAVQYRDDVIWAAGANCGEWTVTFDKEKPSPLDPDGPYYSTGPRGGQVVREAGAYPYSIEAVDRRTGETVTYDPDVVVVPIF